MDNHDPYALKTVSVIIPCFNAGDLLIETIDSIICQQGDFLLLEILVIDDGSSDKDTAHALSLAQQKEKVSVLSNTRTKGPSGARNTGANLAKGRWLAFLDADDIWPAGSLQARISALEQYPHAKLVSGDFQIWDSSTGETENNFFATRERPAIYFGPAYQQRQPVLIERPIRQTLLTAICHSCSVLIERELFLQVGGYEERLMYKEDHHLWFKLAHHTDFVLVPQSLFLYRQHSGNMTKRACSPFEYEKAMLDFILQSENVTALRDAIETRYHDGLIADARWHRERGEFGRALSTCIAGLQRSPLSGSLWRQTLAALCRL